jgi:hypothetical protein
MDALKRVDAGLGVPEVCRELGISSATLQVARQVWWYGHLHDGPHEGAQGRERSP